MWKKPIFTEKGEILCPTHNQELKYFRNHFSLFNNAPQVLCDSCVGSSGGTQTPQNAKFQTDSQRDTFSISLINTPKPIANSNKTDFLNCQLEHIIQDYKANGYAPRNLVYSTSHDALIACCPNGRVVAWKITDDSVQMIQEFSVEGTIRCAKYFPYGGGYPSYLALGVNQDLYIYAISRESRFSLVTKIECYTDINDIEVVHKEQKLIVAGWSNFLKVYSLKDFSFLTTIDATSYGASSPVCTVIHIEKQNALALEDMNGICLVPLTPGGYPLPSYKTAPRKETGLGYLPMSERLLLRTEKNGIQIIDATTMTLISEFKGLLQSTEIPGFRFRANENETQIISNANAPHFALYDLSRGKSYAMSSLSLLKQTASVESLNGNKRFAVADQYSGTILIYQTNLAPGLKEISSVSTFLQIKSFGIPTIPTLNPSPMKDQPIVPLNLDSASPLNLNITTIPVASSKPDINAVSSPKQATDTKTRRSLRSQTKVQVSKAPKVAKSKALFKKTKVSPKKIIKKAGKAKNVDNKAKMKNNKKQNTKTKVQAKTKKAGVQFSKKKKLTLKITMDIKILSKAERRSIGDGEQKKEERRGRRKISEEREEKRQETRNTSRSRSKSLTNLNKEKVSRKEQGKSTSKERSRSPKITSRKQQAALVTSRETRSSTRRASRS